MYRLLLALLCSSCLFGLKLIEKLGSIRQGTYFVIQQDRTLSLLVVPCVSEQRVVLEEFIGVEGRKRLVPGMQGKHYDVDLATGYSENPFLTTLLTLSFHEIPPCERRKAGKPPPPWQEDQRPIWQPPLIVEGKRIAGAKFDGFSAIWPQDGSNLSGTTVDIYLPREGSFACFPFWLQVKGCALSAHLRVIDCGIWP